MLRKISTLGAVWRKFLPIYDSTTPLSTYAAHTYEVDEHLEYKRFVERINERSGGMFQIFCFFLPFINAPQPDQVVIVNNNSNSHVAVCPFTKLYAFGQSQEHAVQQLVDVFSLLQIVNSSVPQQDVISTLYNINERASRGFVQEGTFVKQSGKKEKGKKNDPEYITTFMIDNPMLRKTLKGNDTNSGIGLLISPHSVQFFEQEKGLINASTSQIQRELALKMQKGLTAGEARFVCWEKCSVGIVYCTDLYKFYSPEHSQAPFKVITDDEEFEERHIEMATLAGDTIQWKPLEDSEDKRFEFWFGASAQNLTHSLDHEDHDDFCQHSLSSYPISILHFPQVIQTM